MRRLVSWILVGMMVLSGCASSAPPPIESGTDTSEPERLPEVLSSFKPGDRIEVWAKSGECFEAEFVAYGLSTLTIGEKTYKRTYQRDDKHHRDQAAYRIEEIARVRIPPKPGVRSFTANPYINAAIGTVLFAVVAFFIAWGVSVHNQ